MNTIIMYKGGGYDGCFWEYNAALLHNKKLYDIYTSGCSGIPLFRGDVRKLTSNVDIKAARDHAYANDGWDVKLDNQDDIDGMTSSIPADFVKRLLSRVAEITNIFYAVKCSVCDEHFCFDDMQLSEPHGCGGIMSCCDDFICENCYSDGSCRNCHSYYGSDQLVYDGLCEYCVNDIKNNISEDDPRVTDLERAIVNGKKQLDEMVILFPDRAETLRGQHLVSVNSIKKEIADILNDTQTATGRRRS